MKISMLSIAATFLISSGVYASDMPNTKEMPKSTMKTETNMAQSSKKSGEAILDPNELIEKYPTAAGSNTPFDNDLPDYYPVTDE
jgi:hypothetical protein